MAVVETKAGEERRYYGLSSDTKPSSVPANSTFHEVDTDDDYVYSGSTWYAHSPDFPLSSLNGTQAQTVANVNAVGGVPLIHRILVPSGANGDVDVVLTHKSRVIDAWLVLKGAGTAGCLVTVKNGATAITDAINPAAGGDKAIFRAGTIDDAQHEIAAAGTLRVSKASTGGDFPGCELYVSVLRVA